jgi:hypothetical protein
MPLFTFSDDLNGQAINRCVQSSTEPNELTVVNDKGNHPPELPPKEIVRSFAPLCPRCAGINSIYFDLLAHRDDG